MRSHCDGWVGALLDVLLFELGDQGSLDGGTAGGQSRRIDGRGRCDGGEDGRVFVEDVAEVCRDARGVRGSS